MDWLKTKLKGASIILTSAVLLGTSFLNFSPLGAIAKDEGKVGQSYGKVNQNNVKSVPNAKKKDQKDTIVTPEESTFFQPYPSKRTLLITLRVMGIYGRPPGRMTICCIQPMVMERDLT